MRFVNTSTVVSEISAPTSHLFGLLDFAVVLFSHPDLSSEIMSVPEPERELVVKYDLERCVSWIKEHSYNRVCLQFPDDLLVDSIDVALYIDGKIEAKTYILADTSFFSCCVDELGSKHIDGDAIIHFGYSCLSQFSSLPVLYVWPKRELDLVQLLDSLAPVLSGPSLIAYDVDYAHLRGKLEDALKLSQVVVSRLVSDKKSNDPCGPWCRGDGSHSTIKCGHAYCVPEDLETAVYVGTRKQADHLLLSLKVQNFYTYDPNEGLTKRNSLKLFKKLSFLVEKVKNSTVFGLLIGTLSIERYLDAIDHIKRLLARRQRKCFIISVGKPTVAKLSNFPEIDVFVMVSCNEGSYIDNKEIIVPIVTLLEVELAFNENRSWNDPISTDFSYLLQGGGGFIEAPTTITEDVADLQLTSGFRSNTKCTDESTEIAVRSDMTITSSSFSSRPRTWDGLELKVSDTAPSVAAVGRTGTAQGYSSEVS